MSNEPTQSDNGSGKTSPAWYIKHASLIIGLGFGLAVAAGFSYMKNEHYNDPAVPSPSVVDSDVPELEIEPNL